jgi:alkaline phosphatase D
MIRFSFFVPLLISCIHISILHGKETAGYLFQAGPMVGHVDDSSGTVWLRIRIGADLKATATQKQTESGPSRVEDLGGGFYRLHFGGLEPAMETSVRIEVRRSGDETEIREATFRTAPKPSATGTVRLGFGSCSKVSQYGTAPIYNAIADEKPDFFIFGGDNVYFIVGDGSSRHFATTGPVGDWNLYESMLARHLRTRMHPDLQRMLRSVPSYAIWDDHDYGPNDEGATFPMKEEAARAFKLVWANPSYGSEEIPGIYSSFRHGPVEVFLMDNRTHKYSPRRHADLTPETGVIWGEAQMDWLMAGLKASTAPVKLIANGTQVMSMGNRGEGHHTEALGERRRLLEFLERERIGGVAFLTGDRHYSEAMQQAQSDGTLVLDLTSSPMQDGQKVAAVNYPHPSQIWSMRGNSYGLVTVHIPAKGTGTIRFEARDEENRLVVIDGAERATTWRLEQLNY